MRARGQLIRIAAAFRIAVVVVVAAACDPATTERQERVRGQGSDARAVGVVCEPPGIAPGAGSDTATALPSAEHATRLPVEEDLRLGSTNDPYRFAVVEHLTVARSGQLILFDNRTHELRSYDAAGAHFWSQELRGRGEDPFASVRDVRVVADTIFVLDNSGGSLRVLRFILGGTPLSDHGQITLTGTPPLRENSYPLAFARFGDHWALLVVAGRTYEARTVSLHDGRIGCPFWIWTDTARREVVDVGVRLFLSAPFAPQPHFALANDAFHFAEGREFRIQRVDASNRPRAFVLATQSRPVTREIRAEYVDSMIARNRQVLEPADSAMARAWVRDAPAVFSRLASPDHRPVVGGLWVADDGAMAVRRSDLSVRPWAADDSTILDILEADGSLRGRAILPGELSIRAFTGSHIIGIVAAPEASQATLARRREPASERSARHARRLEIVRFRIGRR